MTGDVAPGASPAGAPGQSRPTRALVVDDERLNRDVIIANLRIAGYDTEIAEDGQQAWEMLDADPEGFDVILLDRRMPRMDGMTLMAKLKDDERLRDIPVIMQTALSSPEEVAEGLQAGVFYYLAKPLDRRLLLSVLASAVEERFRVVRLRRELDRGNNALSLMTEGEFSFRTLDEGNALAVALARACPRTRFMVVGLSEIFTNAIEHGNLGIGSAEKERLIAAGRWAAEIALRLEEPSSQGKRVNVRFRRLPGEVRITVRDDGAGFDWRRFVALDSGRAYAAHGRGIAMARQLVFDAVEYRDPGNEVELVIRGEAPVSAAEGMATTATRPLRPPQPTGPDDIKLAGAMQKELQPRPDLLARIAEETGLEVSGFHEFSSDLGGDLWGVERLDTQRVALWLADFSGHGVSAALNAFRLHALIGSLGGAVGNARRQPSMVLAELNRSLVGLLPVGQYATMLYGVVDQDAGTFIYAAAAAPAPLVVAAGAAAPVVGDGSGLPLGISRSAVYPDRRMALALGDMLFLASDALAENPHDDGSRLGSGGVVDMVCRGMTAGARDVEAVLAPALARMVRPLRDDLTAVCCLRRR